MIEIGLGSEFDIYSTVEGWIPCRITAEVREGVFEYEMDGSPAGIIVTPVIEAMARNGDLRIRRTGRDRDR
jgi:hypothetical protein